ncbi:MAG: TonB-dependent receptor [Acidobacteria bacterium]|nr:TonB-dependent receptor [Acidobacteriota bacterium]MBI3261592.1 TonB-dependent receptor [Acidobacteriota bacterium]
MDRRLLVVMLAAATLVPALAGAQVGSGSLRGYIRDEQGAVLPGVTVTATSPGMLGPVTSVSGADGYYRLVNLAPGTYTVTAELAGFQTYKREAILLRAGATFAVDITMKIGTLSETITVSGESPMLEVSKPSNVLNINGEFQREMPIHARRNWTDFMELTPGVNARPFDDGSGRMVYFGHATEHFAHVVQLEGMNAGSYNDFQPTYVQMGADMIDDIQVKTGGVDASTPMGTGLAINVVTKSGGNTFKGSGGYALQPLDWAAENTTAATVFKLPSELGGGERVSTAGTTPRLAINQVDASLGGPIKRDRMWFFGSYRFQKTTVGISRIDKQVSDIKAFFPDRELFNNEVKNHQPYAKVTSRLGTGHELAVFYQQDRLHGTNHWEWYYDPIGAYSNGGGLIGAKLSSAWGSNVTTSFVAGYNNKHGADAGTYEAFGFDGSGPNVVIYGGTRISGGLIQGTGRILEGGNRATNSILPASLINIRGDLTWFKQGWVGSHEVQIGFFAAPHNVYDLETRYNNNGFILEERVPVDLASPSLGTRPFRRQYASPTSIQTRQARDSDYGMYVQDSWRPGERLTANIGLRVDFVKRVDKIFDVVRQKSTEIQPRAGFSYLVTKDARNLLRASYARVPEQVMGRDAVTLFGAGSKVSVRNEYDTNLDGVFETIRLTPAVTAQLAGQEFAPDLHQPYIDEFIIGFRKQFPQQMSLDVAWLNRVYNDNWALVDINGFWPSGPGQPFGGWGRVDPNRGRMDQQTNNSWSRLNYRAIELTLAKNMTHNFQAMVGINRQWHHISGTWNPTDPARFIQPSAFPSDRLIPMPRGNNEENSLAGFSYGPTWTDYSLRFGGTYLAPGGISMAASLTVQSGPWSGPLIQQLAASDPEIAQFGPTTFRLPNGTIQSNPLSTRNRFAYATRGAGQIPAPAINTLGLKIGKIFRFARTRQFEFAGSIFNALNAGGFHQFTYSTAYATYSPNFLQMRSRQNPRALQLTMVVRF